MPDLTDAERTAYGMITLFGREEDFKPRLDALVKRRQEAEEVEARNHAARAELQKLREDTNLEVAQKTEALNKAKAEHDQAAEEAHKRITLAQERESFLQQKEDDLKSREQALAASQANLKANTERFNGQINQLRAAVADVPKLKAALDGVRALADSVKEKLG